MTAYIPPPLKIEFPEQLALSQAINGSRQSVAASEKAVGSLNVDVMRKLGLLKDDLLKNLYPVGCPIPCPTDAPPSDDFFIMKGQAFDGVANPILASIYGSNLLDMRGMAIVGKKDGETVLAYEADGNKSHSHSGSANSTNLGTKNTSSGGHHTHSAKYQYAGTRYDGNASQNDAIQSGNGTIGYAGLHTHSVAIGSHGHSLSINASGNAQTTIRNRKFNWMVRKG